MSFREIREKIIAENVPKLVKSLLGIDVSYKKCRNIPSKIEKFDFCFVLLQESDPNLKVGVD